METEIKEYLNKICGARTSPDTAIMRLKDKFPEAKEKDWFDYITDLIEYEFEKCF